MWEHMEVHIEFSNFTHESNWIPSNKAHESKWKCPWNFSRTTTHASQWKCPLNPLLLHMKANKYSKRKQMTDRVLGKYAIAYVFCSWWWCLLCIFLVTWESPVMLYWMGAIEANAFRELSKIQNVLNRAQQSVPQILCLCRQKDSSSAPLL